MTATINFQEEEGRISISVTEIQVECEMLRYRCMPVPLLVRSRGVVKQAPGRKQFLLNYCSRSKERLGSVFKGV